MPLNRGGIPIQVTIRTGPVYCSNKSVAEIEPIMLLVFYRLEKNREELLSSLASFASTPSGPSIVLVTHHVEDIPENFTHAALMSNGQMIKQGYMQEVMSEENLSQCFDLQISLLNEGGRYFAKVLDKP